MIFLVQVDAELLVKDLKKSVKRRPSSAVGVGNALSGNGQQQGTHTSNLLTVNPQVLSACDRNRWDHCVGILDNPH